MANEEHLEILRRGIDAWNQWRKENPNVTPDLSGAHLSGAHLSGVHLREADLSRVNLSAADLDGANLSAADLDGADLREANLWGADLSGANLGEAHLSGAHLVGAHLSGANLSGANLGRADLNGANLSGANLSGADLAESFMGWTAFGGIDLSQVKGLNSVRHEGPLTIGIDTIYKSQGKIPDDFLRQAGIPDAFITYIPSLIGQLQPVQFYSCFISYSHKDEPFAKRLHSRMRDEHLRVWFAPEDIKAGRKVHEQIEAAIRYYDKLLLLLSDYSMESQWVETEIYHARQREIREKRRVLFPIRLVDFKKIKEWKCFDADTGRDMAREIREYFIPDFSNWKDHNAFEEAFGRLLRDLKAEDSEAP